MILPDSTIEVAARALYEDLYPPRIGEDATGFGWDNASKSARDDYMQQARAMLTAALPDLIEICAKVAEGVEGASESESPYAEGRRDAAGLIRSLLTTPEDK